MLNLIKKSLFVLFFSLSTYAFSQDFVNTYQNALNNSDFDLLEKLDEQALNSNDPGLLIAVSNSYAVNHPNRAGDYEKVFQFNLEALKIEPALYGGTVANFTAALSLTKNKKNEVLKVINQSNSPALRNVKTFLLVADGNIDLIPSLIQPRVYFGIVFKPESLEVLSIDLDSSLDFLNIGDKVLSINNQQYSNFDEFTKIQSTLKSGKKSTISFLRNNTIITKEFVVPELSLNIYDEFNLLNSFTIQGLKEDAIAQAEKAELKLFKSGLDITTQKYFSAMIDFAYCNSYAHNPNIDLDKLAFNKCVSTIEKIDTAINALIPPDVKFSEVDKQIQLVINNPFLHLAYKISNSIVAEYYLSELRWKKNDAFVIKEPDVPRAMEYVSRAKAFSGMLDRDAISFAISKIALKEFDEHLVNALELAKQSNTTYYAIDGLMRLVYLYGPNGPMENLAKEINALQEIVKVSENSYYQVRLGSLYEKGIGIEKSSELAFQLYETAAEQDHPYALYRIGNAYLNGIYYKKDINEGIETLKKSKELGSNDAAKLLIAFLMDNKINGQDKLFSQLYSEQSELLLEKVPEYLVLGFSTGINSFPIDYEESCRISKKLFLEKDYFISKYVNGYCEISNNAATVSSIGINELLNVSNNGSSKASAALSLYYLQQNNTAKADEFAKKARQQLRKKDSEKIYSKYAWLNKDSRYFEADKKSLDSLVRDIEGAIKEEKAYLAKINSAKQENERRLLAQQRAAQRAKRNEVLSNAASGFFNFLGDVLIVAVTVAATAAVIDEVADSNPEILEGWAKSQRSYNYNYSYEQYDWDGFYDVYGNWTYRCRSILTGRFAENFQCIDKLKDDDRWPTP